MSGRSDIVQGTQSATGWFGHPDAVPAHVDTEAALKNLAQGRPLGEATELVVQGVRCPAVKAGVPGGAPVLCVHGLGHDMWDWRPFFERTSSTFSLAAFDLPGFGLAQKPDRPYPLFMLANAVQIAAETLFDAPPVVVASSLGGHVAMLSALRHPETYAGLVLVSPGGLHRPPLSARMLARSYYSERSIKGRKDADIIANSRKIFAAPSDAREILAARKLAVHRSDLKPVFARPFSRVVDDVFNHPVASRVHRLKMPVTFIHGAKDPVVPVAPCKEAARRLNAPMHILDEVAHLPHVEAADVFAGLVRDFVGGVFSERIFTDDATANAESR